jgi:hypothetical protein
MSVESQAQQNRGYYMNSLRSWREELISDQRKNIARLLRMERMNHPDASDQKALIRLQDKFIGLITEAEGRAPSRLR